MFDDVVGARERKLVHAMAERLGLTHWSEGYGTCKCVCLCVCVAAWCIFMHCEAWWSAFV